MQSSIEAVEVILQPCNKRSISDDQNKEVEQIIQNLDCEQCATFWKSLKDDYISRLTNSEVLYIDHFGRMYDFEFDEDEDYQQAEDDQEKHDDVDDEAEMEEEERWVAESRKNRRNSKK